MPKAHDFEVIDQGSLVGISPVSEEAKEWIDENVESEGWQWMGNILWIDHRCADALIEGMIEEGLLAKQIA